VPSGAGVRISIFGQLGNGGITAGNATPAPVMGLPTGETISQLSVGVAHNCAVMAVMGSGDVWCWGRNDDGELGDRTRATNPIPVQVAGW